jgi:phosphoglycerate dehydrogenase-like enzyme
MKIVATSPSFSKHSTLVLEINKLSDDIKLNLDGVRLKETELIDFVGDADALIVGLEKIDEVFLDRCKNLKIIAKYGVGLDNIDLEACKKRNIAIGWSGGINKLSVAEMALGFMLSLSRNLFQTSLQLKSGDWNKNGGFQLSEKTIGIIGVGHIGKEVIRLLAPFNCNILVNDIIDQKEYYQSTGVHECTKDEIFKRCDIITLHTPLTKDTECLINAKSLSKMQTNTIVINTARGGLIEEKSLKTALSNNQIKAAAIDTYDHEPPSDQELIKLKNLFCTPHIGGNSNEAILAMGMSAINHIKKFKEEI